MAHFSGTGDATTPTFQVRPDQMLRLRWTFRCASATQPGTFEIQSMAAATRRLDGRLDELGAFGRGVTVVHPGGASDYLVVTSSCSWAAKAIQRS